MGRFVVILAVLGLLAWALVKSLREQRLAWVRKLGLPGLWHAEQDGVRYRLTLAGGPAEGTYVEVRRDADGERSESGRWAVRGQALELAPDDGAPQRYELRLFAPGRIGLHGPGRERRVYEREAANVVPLPTRDRP